jgi:serine/threonine protein kinase
MDSNCHNLDMDSDRPSDAGAGADTLPVVPGYELGERIGRGGMGDVYRARDLELDSEVAVKILQPRYPSLAPLRPRADFQKLFADLEAKGK